MSTTNELAPVSEKTQAAEDPANTGADATEVVEAQDDEQQPPDAEEQPESDDKPAAEKSLLSGEGDDDTADGPPETYELAAPQGTELDGEVMAEYESVARELNLPNEGAQKILDQVLPKMAERAQEIEAAQRAAWRDEIAADKGIGGDRLPKSLEVALQARDAFGDAEFKQLLEGPLGDNPAMIRMLHQVGSRISEDGHISGNGPAPADLDMRDPADRAKAFYPKPSAGS